MANLNRLTQASGTVFEPVPEALRVGYKLWRGIHLGVLAANIIEKPAEIPIGTFEDVPVLFSPYYEYAYGIAGRLAAVDNSFQWDDEVHGEFLRSKGFELPATFPSVVTALNPQSYNVDLVARLIDQEPTAFHFFPHITLNMLDPYSQEFINNFFAD